MTEFAAAVARVRAGEVDAPTAAAGLLALMTTEERLGLLDGDQEQWAGMLAMARAYNERPVVAGEVRRLGVPGIRFTDGPRGVVVGRSTSFPVAIARAATWDVDLETRVARAIGAEARAQGANLFAGICVNLLRHPGWGRAQECYGEDPVLTGAMGAATARGAGEHVMTCVKHFALNSIDESRFVVDVEVDEATLHEVYLPHFRTVVASGVDSVMSAYNSVNGQWCGQNPTLLTDVLRDEWGFDGFVMTDFVWGLRDPVGSLEAGQDLEMPFRQQRARSLPEALRDGRLSADVVDRSALRLLTAQVRHAARLGDAPRPDAVACAEHRALARETATRAMVLLRNENVDGGPLLPLDIGAAAAGGVAVIGPLADAANLGDTGSSQVRPPDACSVLAGLREALGATAVTHHDGRDPVEAGRIAARSGTAVVVVGLGPHDEGEAMLALDPDALATLGPPLTNRWAARVWGAVAAWGPLRRFLGGGDRRDLRLHRDDEELVLAVAAANPRTVVVVIGGSAIVMEAWRHRVPAVLMAWYPGMEGGRAVADVLLGTREPGGRLPFAVPTDAAHLPPFDPAARHVVYDAWHGQHLLDRDGHAAAYPFGFGSGYTTFALDDLHVETDGSSARVRVTNTGGRDGATVVQVYAVDSDEPPQRCVHRLVGFTRIVLPAGASSEVDVGLDLGPLHQRDPRTRTWRRRDGDWHVLAAQHAHDPGATASVPLPG